MRWSLESGVDCVRVCCVELHYGYAGMVYSSDRGAERVSGSERALKLLDRCYLHMT